MQELSIPQCTEHDLDLRTPEQKQMDDWEDFDDGNCCDVCGGRLQNNDFSGVCPWCIDEEEEAENEGA